MDTTTNEDLQLNTRKYIKFRWAPVLVLLILAPSVAELLLGDVPLNASLPFLMLLNLAYYGTGAIIIREIVRRRGLGWAWIPVLAFAYGLIEEGLVLHSLFNSHFPGIGALGLYGDAFGVSWVWACYVIGLHTIWSISTPILLTELLFPKYRNERWLSHIGFAITCIIFVLAMAFLAFVYSAYITPRFHPTTTLLIATAIVILAILALVLFVPVTNGTLTASSTIRRSPSPCVVGIPATLACLIFLFVPSAFASTGTIPAPIPILLDIVLAVAAILLIRRWSAPGTGWNDTHYMALVFSTMLGYCCVGCRVTDDNIVNLIFHIVLSVITIALLILMALKVHQRVLASSTAQSTEIEKAAITSESTTQTS